MQVCVWSGRLRLQSKQEGHVNTILFEHDDEGTDARLVLVGHLGTSGTPALLMRQGDEAIIVAAAMSELRRLCFASDARPVIGVEGHTYSRRFTGGDTFVIFTVEEQCHAGRHARRSTSMMLPVAVYRGLCEASAGA